MGRRLAAGAMLAAIVYLGSYGLFRATHAERWERDGKDYVLFPDSGLGHALYLVWRPLSRADEALTGMCTHIGPHR